MILGERDSRSLSYSHFRQGEVHFRQRQLRSSDSDQKVADLALPEQHQNHEWRGKVLSTIGLVPWHRSDDPVSFPHVLPARPL
jgi:hypothetical protein